TEFFRLHAEESGQSPDRQRADQNQRDAHAAEMAARQELLQLVVAAPQKVLQIGWPRSDRLRTLAPRPLRTRAPRAAALILPRHINSPLGGPGSACLGRMPSLAFLPGFIGDRPGPYNASFRLEAAMPDAIIVNANIG